jgi:hypothetical protein
VSSKRTVRIFLCDGVHVRRRARFDGIALQAFLVSDTPTVVYTVPTQNHVRIGGQFTWVKQLHETNLVLHLNHAGVGERRGMTEDLMG